MRVAVFFRSFRMATVGLVALAATALSAQTFTVVHTFTGGSDGQSPSTDLILDANGILYGTTYGLFGGGGTGTGPCGTIFRIDTKHNNKETILHRFHQSDGCNPLNGHLVLDSTGNLYGTTQEGGAFWRYPGGGTAFKLNLKSNAFTLVHSFKGVGDGTMPAGTLVVNASGIYGTATFGGQYGYGVIFKISPKGVKTNLHSFQRGTNNGGNRPEEGLISDGLGNLYGVTRPGGGITDTTGDIFRITQSGKEKTLYHFTGGADGGSPQAPLYRDAHGNLYGTTYLGGTYNLGTIFKLDAAGKETVLYSFSGINNQDGANPAAGLTPDGLGNFYGTTFGPGLGSGSGTIFKMEASGNVTILYRFPSDGSEGSPSSGLVRDSQGNLYGVTSPSPFFPTGYGIVYRFLP
jgi:uncharacterized repeat protein (TIGR03803 family)